jgi:uncharacterized membrane protein YidH (DUF202 family)
MSPFRNQRSAKPAAAYKKPIAIPVRVEPKVFFANERTFLHWTKVSVMISTLGLALLHAPPSAGMGGKPNQRGMRGGFVFCCTVSEA